jgi:lysophospholipase L1-like esterase
VAPPPIRYLALGDSFTIGTGLPAGEAFPFRLAERWRDRGRAVELTDPAVNGYTTDDLIAHELPLVATVRPTLVTLLVGANDIVRGGTLARYRAQLERILASVPAERTVALPQPDWSHAPAAARFGDPAAVREAIAAHNAALAELARARGARYVDLVPLLRRQADAGMYAPDGLHPSAAAHAEWAAALDAALGDGALAGR